MKDKLEILLIEDDEADVFYLREILSGEESYKIRVAGNIKDARKIYADHDFDLVLLDLSLPDSGQSDTLTAVQSFVVRLPIIILTGLDSQEVAVQAVRKGAQDFLVKGRINKELLTRAIRYALERNALQLMRDDVDHIIRHDLKTPVISMINFFKIIKRDNLSKENMAFLAIAQNSAYKMLNIIDMTQTLIKIELGQYKLIPEKINMIDILNDIKQNFSFTQQARHEGTCLSIRIDEADKKTGVFIKGSKPLMFTLINTLLINANEAAGEAEITIKLEKDASQNLTRLSICNPGEVPQVIQASFFNKYITSKAHGLGLGTYTAKLITELHQGNIQLDISNPGLVCIKINLPLLE